MRSIRGWWLRRHASEWCAPKFADFEPVGYAGLPDVARVEVGEVVRRFFW